MKKTFGGRIRLLHWCTSQAMNESLAQIGLTSAQGHIMGRLMHSKEHLRARDIEREFCLSHPTVSGILSRLEKKGFIELRPDPADKRCKRIYVLDKGRIAERGTHAELLKKQGAYSRLYTAQKQLETLETEDA